MEAAAQNGRDVVPVDRFLGPTRLVALGLVLLLMTVLRPLTPIERSVEADLGLAAAVVGGLALPMFFLHPFRVTGLCPPAVLLAGAAVFAAWGLGAWPGWAVIALGFATGIGVGAWLRYEFPVPRPSRRRRRVPVLDWTFLAVVVVGFGLLLACDPAVLPGEPLTTLLIVVAGLVAYTWVRLFRPLFELGVEVVVWRNYRITGRGSGLATFPATGPVLVIANHACWWDPLFLAKVIPRPITPMMTSVFYDKWFLKPLMVYVFQTIRVAEVHIRREAPEIGQAIQALDDGKCVVIFPEGFLRRKDEVPLRRFGRGVWEILKARPQTPVVAAWIEGAWGSYASYKNGPPTKNKPRESRRPITVGVSAPLTVKADTLQHHLPTRLALMNDVSRAREEVGLARLPEFEWKAGEEADSSSTPPGRD